jgi:hypothetical protein
MATVLLVLFFAIRLAAAPEVTLVDNNKSAWRLFVPAKAGPVEIFARDELRKYVAQMSGVRLGDTERDWARLVIVLGVRSDLKTGATLPAAKPGFDGYSILIEPKRIVIAGDNPRGVLYGVYDLLERLGCRWFIPALDPKDPEVVPKRSTLSLPTGAWSEASPLEVRIYNGSSMFFEILPERLLPQIDWAAKNRYNAVSWQAHHAPGSVAKEMEQMKEGGALDALDRRGLALHGPCHSFPFFLPSEKYFDAHPEWFGLFENKRRKHGGEVPLVNYCWSNPEANEEFFRNIEAFLKKYPQIKMFCPVWIDGGKLCQCEKCQKRGGSNLVVDLFNQLSERLEKSVPGVVVHCVLGYAPANTVPTAAVPNGKWLGLYAHWGRNHMQSYRDPYYGNRANLEVWESYFGQQFQICSYYAAASHQPFNGPPFFHALEGDTKYLVEHGLKGTYVLQYPHGFWWNYSFDLAAAGIYPYYFPNRPPRDQARDYATNYFGPEAGPLLATFFEMLGDTANLDISYRASRGEATDSDLLWLRDAGKMLTRAAMLTRKEKTYAYRVAKLNAGHEILVRWGGGLKRLKEAQAKLADFEKGRATKQDVQAGIDAARHFSDDLVAEAEKVEKKYPGVTSAEWLQSWYINRVFLEPLKKVEGKLESEKVGK